MQKSKLLIVTQLLSVALAHSLKGVPLLLDGCNFCYWGQYLCSVLSQARRGLFPHGFYRKDLSRTALIVCNIFSDFQYSVPVDLFCAMLSASSHSFSVMWGEDRRGTPQCVHLLSNPRAISFSSSIRLFIPHVLQSVHRMFKLFSSVQVTQTAHNNAYKASLVLVQILSQPH